MTSNDQLHRQKGKLKPGEVKYLAFEGGGGKGFAYLGAIEVLEKLNVLQNVEGFAGASAGAITAFLLSIGFTHAELTRFISTTNFDTWWEPAMPRVIPVSGGPYVTRVTEEKENLIRGLAVILEPALRSILLALGVNSSKEPVKSLLDHLAWRIAFLNRDMGLWPAQAPRDLFNSLIHQKLPDAISKFKLKPRAKSYGYMTFLEHLEIFRKMLVVTATNLSTTKTELFSATTTPDFPVADAIRISMGLPYFFKPYVLTQTKMDSLPPCGTYVDGGLFNNLPFRELEGEQVVERLKTKTSPPEPGTFSTLGSAATDATLLLRLDEFKSKKINTFADIILKVLENGFAGSGKSQIFSRYDAQTILLDTAPLGLVEFSPPTSTQDLINKRSRRSTYEYFEVAVPHGDRDPKDEALVNARRTLAAKGACD